VKDVVIDLVEHALALASQRAKPLTVRATGDHLREQSDALLECALAAIEIRAQLLGQPLRPGALIALFVQDTEWLPDAVPADRTVVARPSKQHSSRFSERGGFRALKPWRLTNSASTSHVKGLSVRAIMSL